MGHQGGRDTLPGSRPWARRARSSTRHEAIAIGLLAGGLASHGTAELIARRLVWIWIGCRHDGDLELRRRAVALAGAVRLPGRGLLAHAHRAVTAAASAGWKSAADNRRSGGAAG